MDFVPMSCPYCGRAVDPIDSRKYVCSSCGKFVYTDRADVRAFIRPSEIEDRFNGIFESLADGNEKKAMDIAGDLVDSTDCCDHDSLFMRGYVYAQIGEDGKAFTDWKKGLEMLSNDVNLDAYVCLMSKAVFDMILLKEREFVEFNVLGYIDKLCEETDASTGMSCKAFFYYTVYRDCLKHVTEPDIDDVNILKDIIPKIFKRVVAYHRDCTCLSHIIAEYLDHVGYKAETFEEDDNEIPHVYDLIRICLDEHVSRMSEEDRIRVFDRWDDKSLKESLEPMLEAMVEPKKGILSKILKKDAIDVAGHDETIHAYVDRYLLIDGPEEEPIAKTE